MRTKQVIESTFILKTIPLTSSYNGIFSANCAISKDDWEKYFSVEGRIRYGTSVWVQEAFGNGNTIANLSSVGIPAPSVSVSTMNAGGTVGAPVVAGQPLSFGFTNDGGSITSMIWDFGDGTPTVNSLNPPSHRYSKPGTYTITITTIGPDFTDVKTLTIKVLPNIVPILQLLLD